MNRRRTITIVVGLLVLSCLMLQSALAATAMVDIHANQHGTVKSSPRDLSRKSLSGYVQSDASSTSNERMTGYLDTHGNYFTVNRDKKSVMSDGKKSLSWENAGEEDGGFSVSIISPGSHNGICTASN